MYYRYWHVNEAVIFSHCIHLKREHQLHALLKVCIDHDDIVPLSRKCSQVRIGNDILGYFEQ